MRLLSVIAPFLLMVILELPVLIAVGRLRGSAVLGAWVRVLVAKIAPVALWVVLGDLFPNSPAMSWLVGMTVIGGFAIYFAACYRLLSVVIPEPSLFRTCVVLVFVVPLVWIPLVREVGLKLLHPMINSTVVP